MARLCAAETVGEVGGAKAAMAARWWVVRGRVEVGAVWL